MSSKHVDCLSNDVACKAIWVVDPSEERIKAMNLYSRKMHIWTKNKNEETSSGTHSVKKIHVLL